MAASGVAGAIEIATGACRALSPTATVTLPSLEVTLLAVVPSVVPAGRRRRRRRRSRAGHGERHRHH